MVSWGNREGDKMGKHDDLARLIIANVGGADNVADLTHHGATLRFTLKNVDRAHTDVLKHMEGVQAVEQTGDQCRIEIGGHAADVYGAVVRVGRLRVSVPVREKSRRRHGFGSLVIESVADVFRPLLGVLSAMGILTGLLALLAYFGVLGEQDSTYQLLYSIANGFFYFLPVALAYMASEKWGGDKLIGMAVAFSLCYPGVAGLSSSQPMGTLFTGTLFETPYQGTFLGVPLVFPVGGYTSGVVPILVTVLASVRLERLWKKVLPDVLKAFLVPLLTLILIVPLAYLVIGPVMGVLASLTSALFTALFDAGGWLAGLVLGALWQVLVVFGLQWAVIPLATAELGARGATMALSPILAASFIQSAVVLAVLCKTRDKRLRHIAIPAFISGLFGVTEPAVYGVTLPKKKPFVISCIATAIGGAVIGFSQTEQFALGRLGPFGLSTLVNPDGQDYTGLIWVLAVSLAASVVAFAATMATYRDEENEGVANRPIVSLAGEDDGSDEALDEVLVSPVKGNVTSIHEIPDAAFASGAMGQGAGVMPEDGRVYAPCDGKVNMVFDTKHAIGLESDKGAEILIQVGIDTVKLHGKHFEVRVKEGESVHKGQLLMEFDLNAIKEEGYSLMTPVLVTNADRYGDIYVHAGESVQPGQPMVEIR